MKTFLWKSRHLLKCLGVGLIYAVMLLIWAIALIFAVYFASLVNGLLALIVLIIWLGSTFGIIKYLEENHDI